MPHETTYADSFDPDETVPDRRLGVKVQWISALKEVGIMTGLLDEDLDSIESTRGTRQDAFMVWLDRRGINKLIRDLRRARNQACGADE